MTTLPRISSTSLSTALAAEASAVAPYVNLDHALLNWLGRTTSGVARDALPEGTAGAALLASAMADLSHGWLFHLLLQE
jgi:hypothetical protein